MGGRRRGLLIAAAAVLGLAAVAASHAATVSAGLLKIRLGGDATQTRIVIDLDHAATGKVIADGADDRRVVLVLQGAATEGTQGAGVGLVKAWVADQTAGGARLRIDLSADGRIKRRFLLPPADGIDHYRYVVDIAPLEAAPVRPTKAAAPTAVRLRAPLPLKKVVVIDAGHGGNDPGARGAMGLEKDINLVAALALKAQLERTGRYKVVMTREADVYVPLEDRVRVAQRSDADLFISLHSDSAAEPGLRGVSVYTLSDKAFARATRFVKADDWFMRASLTSDPGVSDILFDLTQRATKNRSATFAESLVGKLDGRAPLLRRSHRSAGFMVLLAPDVPAVLLEMGFLSNAQDEQRLRDPHQRAELVEGVAAAIDDYFAESTRIAAR
ncbi:N-acetylmuramoyl-L-alanine amidase [Phenylobacterium sp. LjRoot225]|uniref:N-acetylmuramoyl-L-alanine amidase family protein n=1 Tax=Phenylobacterium sp. LjRoot225 TaxID=3342285 RepID=UPI003ECDE53B